MNTVAAPPAPYAGRARRALELQTVHPHAAEMLRLLQAVSGAQAEIHEAAAAERPAAGEVGAFAAAHADGVVAAAVAAGPRQLSQAASAWSGRSLDPVIAAGLAGDPLDAAATVLARATTSPVLCAVPVRVGEQGGGGCPHCGGRAQVSFSEAPSEALVTGQRRLVCGRCDRTWIHPRMVCAACGETDTSRMPIYAEGERFPHVRVDGCETCRRYLLHVDLARQPGAVPEVDEIAALPLDLYARDRGLSKISINLVGF